MGFFGLSLQTLVLVLAVSFVAIGARESAAATIDTPCFESTYNSLRCGAGLESTTTTASDPDRTYTFNPILPDDPENWELDYLYARVQGIVTYSVVYDYLGPGKGPDAGANLRELSILASSGVPFASTSTGLYYDLCSFRVALEGKWACSDGNTAGNGGILIDQDSTNSAKDAAAALLTGPVTVVLDWDARVEGTPESTAFSVRTSDAGGAIADFGYRFRRVSPAVPEPSAALLYAGGLILFAATRRRAS